MSGVIIRNAEIKDFEPVNRLVKELYDTLEVKEGMSQEINPEKYEDILTDNKIAILVAETNKTVIGYLTLNFNKALLDSGITAIIDELIVTRKYQKKGVAKLLVRSAIEKCKSIGCSEIGVGTEFGNIKAREFYKKCGFYEVGVIFEKILK